MSTIKNVMAIYYVVGIIMKIIFILKKTENLIFWIVLYHKHHINYKNDMIFPKMIKVHIPN